MVSQVFNEYTSLTKAVNKILSKKKQLNAYKDFNISKISRYNYKKWLNNKIGINNDILLFAPENFSLTELKSTTFDKLHSHYGNSIWKLRLIDKNLKSFIEKKRGKDFLSVGGACVLEDLDTIFLSKIKNKRSDDFRKKYIERLLKSTPTWTQITGSIAPKKGLNIFYDETFPWWLKIQQYGIKNAFTKVNSAYKKIYAGVKSYSELINPESKIIKISFTDLKLSEDNYLSDWFQDYVKYIRNIENEFKIPKLSFNEQDFLKSWVEYTYLGPDILDISKKIIKKKSLYKDKLNDISLYVRSKQIDHLTTERSNKWINDYIIRRTINKNRNINELFENKSNIYQVGIYLWQLHNHYKQAKNSFAGFLDFNYHGHIAHEKWHLVNENIENMNDVEALNSIFNSPFRLHSKNVNTVIKFLELFRNEYLLKFSLKMLQKILKKENLRQKLTKKIFNLNQEINKIQKLKSSFNQKNTKFFFKKIEKANLPVQKYFKNIKTTKLFSQDQISFDNLKYDKLLQQVLVEQTDEIVKRQKILIRNLSKRKSRLKSILNKYELKYKLDKLSLSSAFLDIEILPLCNNLFVSYMHQLLFIKDVREVYQEMIKIEVNNDLTLLQKQILIVKLTNRVFDTVVNKIKEIMLNK